MAREAWRKAWVSVGPEAGLYMRALLTARRAGAVTVRLGFLVGNERHVAARSVVERRFGKGVLAKLAADLAERAGLGKVLFVWETEEEREALDELGVRRFQLESGESLFGGGEGRLNGTLLVRCMGERHRLEVRGATVVAVDHTREELELLRRVGEEIPCTAKDGLFVWDALDAKNLAERHICERADIFNVTALARVGRDGSAWVLRVGPALFGEPVSWGHPAIIARCADGLTDALAEAAWKVNQDSIPWSQAAPLLAAYVAREEVRAWLAERRKAAEGITWERVSLEDVWHA